MKKKKKRKKLGEKFLLILDAFAGIENYCKWNIMTGPVIGVSQLYSVYWKAWYNMRYKFLFHRFPAFFSLSFFLTNFFNVYARARIGNESAWTFYVSCKYFVGSVHCEVTPNERQWEKESKGKEYPQTVENWKRLLAQRVNKRRKLLTKESKTLFFFFFCVCVQV